MLRLLIRQWRKDFEDCQLPFFIVQLPGYEEVPVANAWAMVREAQRRVCEEEENTFLVVTLDLGERKDIHPKHKKVLGERVASAALYYVYHVYKENFVYPEICKVSKLDGELLLEAKNLGGTCIVKGGEEKNSGIGAIKEWKGIYKSRGNIETKSDSLKSRRDGTSCFLYDMDGVIIRMYTYIMKREFLFLRLRYGCRNDWKKQKKIRHKSSFIIFQVIECR